MLKLSEQEIQETIRQRVRDVEQTGRQLNLVLSKIHQLPIDFMSIIVNLICIWLKKLM